MAEKDVTLNLKAKDSASATLNSVARSIDGVSEKAAGATAGFRNMLGSVQALAGSVGLLALGAALQKAVQAAAEAEAAQAKLVASLKATGTYSEQAVAGINKWAAELLRAKGVGDEMAASLVAEGVAMGKTIEQSKRLAEAAADMAPIVGSVEAAFSLLVRASNGSMEALTRYGVAVTDAEKKSGDFESVLSRIEQQFSGQAAASVDTYNGQMALLKENFGNLAEEIGGKLLPAANSWLKWVNDAIDAHNRMTASVDKLSDAELRLEMQRLQREKAQAGTLGHFDTDTAAVDRKIAEVQAQLNANARQRAANRFFAEPDAVDPRKFAPVKSADTAAASAAAKTALAAEKKAAEDRAKISVEIYSAEQAAFENMVRLRDSVKEYERQFNLYADEAAAGKAYQPMGAEVRTYDQGLPWMNDALEQSARMQTEAAEEIVKAKEDEVSAALDQAEAAQKSADALNTQAQAAEMSALALQGIGAIIGTALRGGNIGSAAAGVGGQLAGAYLGGALVGTLGKTIAPVVGGIVGDLIGSGLGALLGGNEPRTVGGKGRKELDSILRDAGLKGSWNDQTDANVKATGQWEIWDSLAALLAGPKVGGGAAKLYDALDGLGLAFGDNLQAVSSLVSASKDLTDAEADLAVAQAAIFSTATMSLEELTAAADMWADAQGRITRKAELEKKMQQDLQNYAAAKGTAGTADDNAALQQLEADRGEYVALLRADMEAKRVWEEKLREEGMTGEQINALKDPTKATAENTWGILQELIKTNGGTPDNVPVNPPPGGGGGGGGVGGESYRTRSDLGRGGARGSTVNVIVNGAVGDHKDVAKKLHRELKRLREFGEVSN